MDLAERVGAGPSPHYAADVNSLRIFVDLALPPVAQTLHILLATLVFGVQFYIALTLGKLESVKAVNRL